MIKEGGIGSGNFGHKGRPGRIGGSSKEPEVTDKEYELYNDYWYHRTKTYAANTRQSLLDYCSLGYKSFNRWLRDRKGFLEAGNDETYTKKAVENILSARRPSEQEWTVYRGANERYFKTLSVGDVFEEKGFTSTSISPAMTLKFTRFKNMPTILKFRIPEGKKIIYPSTSTEAEIILPPNQKFKVLKKYNSKVGTTFDEYDAQIVELELL